MSRGKIEFIDGDGLPDIAVDFGRDLSEIPTRQLKVRTSTGVYITKTMLVDDAATGLGHFEFADGELPAGDHLFNIITTELDGRQRSYPASGSIPLLVRNEFSDSLRSNNRNGTITIRGEDTTLEIDVVQTDQRDGSLLLVGTPTDGLWTDGKAVIVSTDTIADAIDAVNEASVIDGANILVGAPAFGNYSRGQSTIVVGDTIADAVDFVNIAAKANLDSSATNATNIGTNVTNIGNNTSAIAALNGASLLVGAPTDGDYTDGKAAIVVGDTIADAVDFVNVALKTDVDNLATYGKWVIDGGNIYRNSLVGIGATPDLGTGLHIKTADTGLVTVHSHGDELVIEGGANAGASIISTTNGVGWLIFGDGATQVGGYVNYDSSVDAMNFGSSGTIKMSLYGTYLNSAVPFRAPDGAVGEPGFVFGSDTNSGLHWISADNIALVTGGVGALFVNASGVVGIGDVADLGTGLHIKESDTGSSLNSDADNLVIEENGNCDITIISNQANVGNIYFGSFANHHAGRIVYDHSADNMQFATFNGTTKLTIGSTGGLVVPGQYSQGAITTYTPTATTQAVDWDSGNIQTIDLASATGNVTLTLSNPEIGAKYEIKITQDATTPRNLIWPANVKWPGGTPPVISVGALAEDWVYLTYDGTNYGARFEQNLS